MQKKFYISTPIYYPNDKLHIGHCYTTVICDVFKRFQKNIMKNDCIFITGSDEHGQKIAKKSLEHNLKPKKYVDNIVRSFKNLWKLMNIDYDIFIRTTDKNHIEVVQNIFEELLNKKIIYLGKYQTRYCEIDEEAFNKSELVDGEFCPKCGNKTIFIDEESYFLKCSELKSWIKEVFDKNIIEIIPENKKNEMINNFINDLKDLSVSRTEVKWGVQVRSNSKHTVYVWLDALLNYISALNYQNTNSEIFKKYWSEDCEKIHVIGKEITRFHVIYWPMILKCINIPLPNKIISHGWIVSSDNKKMSKSLKNTMDPIEIVSMHDNSDVLRYFLSRIAKIGDDFHFDINNYYEIYNNELANNIGNIVSRVFAMVEKYYDGKISLKFNCKNSDVKKIYSDQETLINHYTNDMNNMNYKIVIDNILDLVFKCNKLIEDYKPWELYSKNNHETLSEIISCLLKSIMIIMFLLSPFIPTTYNKFLKSFKLDNEISLDLFKNNSEWGKITIATFSPLFLRDKKNK